MSAQDIFCERHGACGLITLNRPKALNALTLAMVGTIADALERWRVDAAITRIVIEANGDRAFSAGGDIRQIYEGNLKGGFEQQLAFWGREYRLNAAIHRYPKPFVALVDGIVMGGGAGISLHASHVVAGDRFSFAMPEVGIGFFPDVGATFFLSHLPGGYGPWLALTGSRIGGDLAHALGLVHAQVASVNLPLLKSALLAGADVDDTIARFDKVGPVPAVPPEEWMEYCFAGKDVVEILDRLNAAAATGQPAAGEAAGQICKKSPTSLAVALRQMQIGRTMTLEEALQTEYRIAARVGASAEFREGVRAAVIDKDQNPTWYPASHGAITAGMIDAIFAPLPQGDLSFDANQRLRA